MKARTSRDEQKNKVSNYLRLHAFGRTNAIGKRALSFNTAVSERNIRLIVNELIDEGMPVCSAVHKPCGYYLPATREEAQEAINTLKSYAREIEDRTRRLEQNVRQMKVEPVQLDLFRKAG